MAVDFCASRCVYFAGKIIAVVAHWSSITQIHGARPEKETLEVHGGD
ncbi:hypothetical protein RISK_003622 [Rhodopirellula islandica]|uniref:Uncharacterized protein n=1 Tax=Rhodopirellula islandica TaxID=595434 RepID=A0A0J1BD98_RHOIS|nr:hypothetical protein RISK_003622 [Rhodopirellula islandica]